MVSESEQLCGAHLRCHSSSTSISVYTKHNKTPLDNNRAPFMTLSSQIKYIYQINILIFLFFLLSHLHNWINVLLQLFFSVKWWLPTHNAYCTLYFPIYSLHYCRGVKCWNIHFRSYPVQPLHISFVITCFSYFAILNTCCSSILYLKETVNTSSISCQVGKESTTMCGLSTDIHYSLSKTFALLPMTSIAHVAFAVYYWILLSSSVSWISCTTLSLCSLAGVINHQWRLHLSKPCLLNWVEPITSFSVSLSSCAESTALLTLYFLHVLDAAWT